MNLFSTRCILSVLLSLWFTVWVATWSDLSAQNSGNTVKGVVTDSDGFAIVGATVLQEGTTNGVITGSDGSFSIRMNSGSQVLQISCLGYKPLTMPVGKATTQIEAVLETEAVAVEEVSVVAYGVQKKETITGAISSVGTEQLLTSPNPSVANSLAGQLTGVSAVQTSGQPGLEDPEIYVRGTGTLNDSSPLVLVDGVEMSFFQMDPNEIESISVLKDASATAVFGVRGANGVILVTTRRGSEGPAKISLTSTAGITRPTRLLQMANSYETALRYNELELNDGKTLDQLSFSPEVIEAFRTHSNPIMYPDTDWADYLYKDISWQTQHNINVSGGTSRVKYFASLGVLYQDGIMEDLPGLDYDGNYTYNRYNFRTNLDIDATKTTKIKLSLGGVVGITSQPIAGVHGTWTALVQSQPFSSAGIVDGRELRNDDRYFGNIKLISGLDAFYGHGFSKKTLNTMNMNLEVAQSLDFITKGLSFTVKGAYNTTYTFTKNRPTSVEIWTPHFVSSINGSGLNPGDPGFDDTVVYRISGKDAVLSYGEGNTKNRDWYMEAALRYARKFDGKHNVTALLLYNQSKTYYPKQFTAQPSAYVGLVGRVTYDYMTRYMVEFNAGYNGSENFPPGKRYGFFPAISAGWIITEEDFMKGQKVFDYLKIRATYGMVGNDKMVEGDNVINRYLYLPSSYTLKKNGYNFGVDTPQNAYKAVEGRIGNPDVTWETAIKQNYGIEMSFLKNRLRVQVDYFREFRKDILIKRNTIPAVVSLGASLMPVVNLGEVQNNGFEAEVKWNHTVNKFNYWISANTTFARNKVLFMDEVEPNEPYMAKTGRQMGFLLGYKTEGFYRESDFKEDGSLIDGLPDPGVPVYPGDVKYSDLNGDQVINADDQTFIGYPTRPEWTFGLNYGIRYKGFDLTMNWVGVTNRSVMLTDQYRYPFGSTANRALIQYMSEERWTPDRADVASMPRLSSNSAAHNYGKNSSLWVRDGSYLRLKTVRLGYTINKGKVLDFLGIRSLNVYVSGYNLLTFDRLKYLDPESSPTNSGTAYPITQTYNLGVNINF